jgi:3-methyladenine DNA glycosylase AlkD
VARYKNAEQREKKKIVQLYLKNRKFINNWDLVDSSAPYILGDYFFNRDKTILYKLAASKRIWDRRMAALATYCFIRNGNFMDTFEIAKILLDDPHVLIYKAVGWMLREVGNRNAKKEEEFLRTHASRMPRTMLRYAMKKFPERKRKEIGRLVHRV